MIIDSFHWHRFEDAINRAITSCEQTENNAAHYFADAGKVIAQTIKISNPPTNFYLELMEVF